MRNFSAQQCTYNNNNTSSTKDDASIDSRPDWMKRLQEKKKEAQQQTPKNIDLDLFPSFNESIGEITYLDDEDDLAESYFPGCDKMGSSLSSIDTDDLTPVSGYNFDEMIIGYTPGYYKTHLVVCGEVDDISNMKHDDKSIEGPTLVATTMGSIEK
eukprot:CAMPEP_0113617352 /NCGR_PEP_ID=MMETSP0017_2-20120614/8734_1 /TAXON_ID=2856 /ORGANISM="Cylindrotheca closterium" /LENGTH=155 /DNA_ID=CAMNT_0000526741 /DNA_START=44 /DNA_END=511 /DNA_ORIENTATION=- /assembly_acc=CAM_ASM_000147